VSVDENAHLTAPYSKKIVFKWNTIKPQDRMHGFPVELYENFLEVIKRDFLDFSSVLHARQLELFHLNFGDIIFLPKVNEAEIQQYMSTCLHNISFKIFTKTATIRLNSVADHVVRPTQTTFIQGRNILDWVVTLHETVHKLHQKKLNGLILEIDIEKA
jgi:hypothetical protein